MISESAPVVQKLSRKDQKQRATSSDPQILSQKKYKIQLNKQEMIQKQVVKRTHATVFQSSFKQLHSNLNQLAAAIKLAGDTRKLSIDFPFDTDWQIGVDDLSYINQSLKGLRSLQILNLRLGRSSNEPDADLLYIGQGLKTLSSLQSLTIRVDFAYYTDAALYSLSQGIKRLSLLKKLNLSFEYVYKTSDVGFQYLSKALKRLTRLEEVGLCLSWCQSVTDFGLSELVESLKNFCLLKRLSLGVDYCHKITDKGLENLSKSLEMLTSLEDIELNFRGCKEITGQGVKSISNVFDKFPRLGNIMMNFSNCIKITDEAVWNFLENLNTLASLKDFEFDVARCPLVTITKKEFYSTDEEVRKKYSHLKKGQLRLSNEWIHFPLWDLNPLSEPTIPRTFKYILTEEELTIPEGVSIEFKSRTFSSKEFKSRSSDSQFPKFIRKRNQRKVNRKKRWKAPVKS